MYRIHYLTDQRSVETTEQETILTTSLRNGIDHLHACGGAGRCSTCRIEVLEGLENCQVRNSIEARIADRLDFPPVVRLACQTKVKGPVKIRRLLTEERDIKFAQANISKSGSIGSNRHVAILFADIEGFTPLSERMPSFDVMFLLNRYFDFAGDVVLRNGGEINNYIGDAFLAVFGLDNAGDEAFRAVSAGLEIQENLKDFALMVKRDFNQVFKVRIGIHYGEVIVGMLGSRGTERLSIIGDTVNTAARTEAANKDADTNMLITESAYEQIKDRVEVKDFVRVKLRGTSERVTLYEIASIKGGTTATLNEKQKIINGVVWSRALQSSAIGEQNKKVIEMFDSQILMFRHKGKIKAVINICPHMNLPIDAGQVTDNGSILCPFHDSAFCVNTGEVRRWVGSVREGTPKALENLMKSVKQSPLKVYEIQEIDGHIWITP